MQFLNLYNFLIPEISIKKLPEETSSWCVILCFAAIIVHIYVYVLTMTYVVAPRDKSILYLTIGY